jgi:hypothetical protein
MRITLSPLVVLIAGLALSITTAQAATAGITLKPSVGLVTTEAGAGAAEGRASFTVVLDSHPTANVTIGLSSDDTTEGTVSPAALTFTSANWDVPQTVTVNGVDDMVDDGDVSYHIVTSSATSADADYSRIDPADISVTNTNNDFMIYVPVVINPVPPPVLTACNDQEPNNIGAEAQPLDPSSGQANLHTSGVLCHGSLQSDPEGEDDYYVITLNPGEVLDVQLTQIPTGADYDLYLYNAQGATTADRVTKSNQVGGLDEHFSWQHPGSTPLTYYLRIYQYRKSPTTENSYLITASIR